MIHTTKIYLVTNCFGDPFKVYIGKTNTSRESKHKFKFGKQILYEVIDEINSKNKNDWKLIETYWIQQFKAWGFKVLNQNEGGGGPQFYSEEIKQKMRKPKISNLGYLKTWTEERRTQQSELHKDRKQSDNWIERRAKSQYKPINCITPLKEIITFECAIYCNNYFSKLFNKKTCFGAINNSLRDNKIVNKGKLKNYKFEYVVI
jgi:hypothetical protein